MKIIAILICILFSFGAYAEEESKQKIQNEEKNQSVEAKKRRKKVLMCKECGKPETHCECEGHRDEDDDRNNQAIDNDNQT